MSGAEQDLVSEAEAQLAAITSWPWAVTQRLQGVMVYEDGECELCDAKAPLVQVERDDQFFVDSNGASYVLHQHEVEPHHIHQEADPRNIITGNYDYEAGGILRGVDVAFMAKAPAYVNALLQELHKARAPRQAVFLPGDLVRIDLPPGDMSAEYSGREGVIVYGPDKEHDPGWQVCAAPGVLRCVEHELTMVTPREDR